MVDERSWYNDIFWKRLILVCVVSGDDGDTPGGSEIHYSLLFCHAIQIDNLECDISSMQI